MVRDEKGRAEYTKDARAGEWTFERGSRFWRPISVVKDWVGVSAKGKEGTWRIEGNSRVWRRQKEVSQDGEGWIKVKGGAKQKLLGLHLPKSQAGSAC